MKFACNYYPETEQLLDEHKIDIDYFKYPGLGFQMDIMKDLDAFEGLCKQITRKRPILLHGLYPAPHDLGSNTLQSEFDEYSANRLIGMTQTPGLSFHPMLSRIPEAVDFHKLLNCIICNAGFMREKYSKLQFVSLENMDTAEWRDLLKPEIISRIIRESGCGFLLDISHAYCASGCLGVPFYEYLRQLPLDEITEIHINGWIVAQGTIMCHTKINEEGYQALAFVLEYCQPKIITVEYGRHNDRIGAGVPVLSPVGINEQAKNEIEEQVYRVREICIKKNI